MNLRHAVERLRTRLFPNGETNVEKNISASTSRYSHIRIVLTEGATKHVPIAQTTKDDLSDYSRATPLSQPYSLTILSPAIAPVK